MKTNSPIPNPNSQTSNPQSIDGPTSAQVIPVSEQPVSEKRFPKWIIIVLITLLFGITSLFAFQNYQHKQQIMQTQLTPVPTILSPTPLPLEPTETESTFEEYKAYHEPDFWYAIEVRQKENAPTPAYYPYAYLRKPIADVLGLQDHEVIEEIVTDTSTTKWGTLNFNGNYFIFVSTVNLREERYENSSLIVNVKKLSDQDLIPYLVDNNYCEQDPDCTIRRAYYCQYGAFNNFESLKDHESGCTGVTFDDEIQQSVDTLCHKLLYQNPSCSSNKCVATQRTYEPISCD